MFNTSKNINLSPYSTEQADIERRRQLMEALQAQSMEPIQQQATPSGGYAVPIAPTQGLAKIAQALAAAYGKSKTEDESKALGEKYGKDRADVVSNALKLMEGTPEQPANTDIMQSNQGLDTFESNPAKPAVPGNRRKAYEALASNDRFPELQNMGLAELLKKPDSPWAKINPKDNTAESNRMFAGSVANNQPDYSLLNPVTKMQPLSNVAGPNGMPQTQFYDPTNPPKEPIPQAVQNQVGPAGQVYNAYQQKPGSVLSDPNKPFQATPGGGQAPNVPYQEYANRAAAAGATRVNVNQSTEKKYGEQFAGEVAKADVSLREAATKAPELAGRANRIKEVLASGDAITGFGADFRLGFGKAAALAGLKSAGDAAANTETLAAGLAQNTMDAIKASGMGGGTGFSNADRDFLEKAVGGKINLEPQALSRLADLAHRAASLTAGRWTTRAGQIPKSAVEGTGVDVGPVTVPPLYGAITSPQGRQSQTAPARINSDAEFNALSSGTEFIGPDGKRRRKP